MISMNDLETSYIHMYKDLRNYIWGFDTVETLADLEIATFSRFPDLEKVSNLFNKLYQDIREICAEDEDLNNSVEKFRTLIESDDSCYCTLTRVKEVNL